MELHTAKEKILNNFIGVLPVHFSEGHRDLIFKAMDEYSRLVACEFTKWVCFLNHEAKTTEQLFDEFIKEYGK